MAAPSRLDQVNLELSAADPGGAVLLAGTLALNGQPLRVDARFGRPTPEGSSTLRLELSTEGLGDAGASTATFGGVVWWRADAPGLRGELAVTGADARSTVGALRTALGQEILPMPPWLAAPFRATGRVGLENDRLELSGVALELDGAELDGRLGVILAAVPEIDLEAHARQLAIPADLSADAVDEGLAPFLALASSVRGKVDLAVGTLDYPGVPLQRVRAALQLSGDGTATIRDARVTLPGQTEVGFAGELTGAGADAELRGKLTAVTENLRAALAALEAHPVQVGGLNALTLASELSLRRDAWRFSQIELRVDATRVTGSVAVNPGPRPQIAANLALDRLDVDAYWPDLAPTDLLGHLAGPLREVDAAIEAQLARLTWHGVHLQDLRLATRAVNGRLRVSQLTVGNIAEAEAHVAGELDLAAGAFDLTAELRNVQAARLLRRVGFDPWPLLARLKPATVEARATGSPDAAHVEVTARDGAATVDLAGEVGWTEQQAHYQLDVKAEHPDYRGLLQDLGAGSLHGAQPAGPLALAGKLEREAGGAATVAGTARLGETSFTGRVAWQANQDRPHFAARISVGEPRAPVLGGLLDLSGLRPEWPAADGGFRGRWSEHPLALPLLDRFDGELMLSSKGGLAGEGLELTARLEQGRLTVEHVALALWQGRLQGQLSVDVRRPLPYLVADLSLEGFDPAQLAALLGVPALVAAPATLHLAATGAGDDVRTLVRSLIGQVEFEARDGVLREAMPEGFAGSDGRPERAGRAGAPGGELRARAGHPGRAPDGAGFRRPGDAPRGRDRPLSLGGRPDPAVGRRRAGAQSGRAAAPAAGPPARQRRTGGPGADAARQPLSVARAEARDRLGRATSCARHGAHVAAERERTSRPRPMLRSPYEPGAVTASGGVAAPGPERALHDHGVEPAPELPAHVLERADQAKSRPDMQLDRGRVRGVADDRHHLAQVPRRRARDHLIEKHAADPLPARPARHVHRILHGMPICRARPIWPRIGVAGDPAVELRHHIRQTRRLDGGEARGHLGQARRLELERGGALAHLERIDLAHLRHVLARTGCAQRLSGSCVQPRPPEGAPAQESWPCARRVPYAAPWTSKPCCLSRLSWSAASCCCA